MGIIEHGTIHRYWIGCREPCCRRANAAYMREYRARRRQAGNPVPRSRRKKAAA